MIASTVEAVVEGGMSSVLPASYGGDEEVAVAVVVAIVVVGVASIVVVPWSVFLYRGIKRDEE